jgi:hypothetical protein
MRLVMRLAAAITALNRTNMLETPVAPVRKPPGRC